MKAIFKMLVTHSTHVKLALLDQVVYLTKELMLKGDAKLSKTLQFTLMNAVRTYLWAERTRFSLQDTSIVNCHILKTETSDIKHIYSSLHVYRLIDMLSLLGLCSKDVEVRQVSVLTLVDLGKLKRLIIKKDLYTPLFDDILYSN